MLYQLMHTHGMKNVKYTVMSERRLLSKTDKVGTDLTLLGREFHFLDAK